MHRLGGTNAQRALWATTRLQALRTHEGRTAGAFVCPPSETTNGRGKANYTDRPNQMNTNRNRALPRSTGRHQYLSRRDSSVAETGFATDCEVPAMGVKVPFGRVRSYPEKRSLSSWISGEAGTASPASVLRNSVVAAYVPSSAVAVEHGAPATVLFLSQWTRVSPHRNNRVPVDGLALATVGKVILAGCVLLA